MDILIKEETFIDNICDATKQALREVKWSIPSNLRDIVEFLYTPEWIKPHDFIKVTTGHYYVSNAPYECCYSRGIMDGGWRTAVTSRTVRPETYNEKVNRCSSIVLRHIEYGIAYGADTSWINNLN